MTEVVDGGHCTPWSSVDGLVGQLLCGEVWWSGSGGR